MRRLLFVLILAGCHNVTAPKTCEGVLKETNPNHPEFPDSVFLKCQK